MTHSLIQLVVIANGLKFEITCPKTKFIKGGILKHAKEVTGLKTNDRAKHLVEVEARIASLRAAG